MKSKFFALLLAVGCMARVSAQDVSSADAENFRFWQAHNPSWYIGGGGIVNDSLTGVSSTIVTNRVGNEGTTNTSSYGTKNPGWGYVVYAGYNANKIIACEFKFSQTVVANKFHVRTLDIPDSPIPLNNQLDYKLKQITFGPATLVSIPINQYFMPYFKGGVYAFRFSKDKSYSPLYTQPTTENMDSIYWDFRLILGYGIRSQFTDHFGMRLDYECATNPIVNTHVDLTQGNLALSVYFTF